MPPPATAMPIGQRLIAAKKLYDTLDPSTMTPDEAVLHQQLGQALSSQPAVVAYSRGARGAAAGPVRPVDPSTVRAPSNAPDWGRGTLEGVARGIGIPTSKREAVESSLGGILDPTGMIRTGKQLYDAPATYEADRRRGYTPGVAATRTVVGMLPGVGGMAKDIGAPMASAASNKPVTRNDNTDALRGTTQAAVTALAPKAVGKAAGMASKAAGRVGGTVLGRFPERMVGSVLGSESRPAARAVMAREIGTAGDPGNLPIENFHNNVTSEWNSAGQDVSRVIAADTALNPGKTVNVQPLVEGPYSARAQQVGKFARGETAILQQLQRLTEHSEARQAAAAEHVGLKPGVDWFPGDPIEMSPQQMHEFTKDWRKSVAGGFDRMDPTEQAVIGNMHDAIKTTVPDAAATMQDYHDLSRAKESLDEKVPRIQGGPLIPSMIETMRGAATRKVVGGAAWKLPVAYWMNRAAPKPYRYTGTFNPAMAPAADAATLRVASPPATVTTAAPQPKPQKLAARAPMAAAPTPATASASAPTPTAAPISATVEANRAFTAEAARLAAERERQYPVRPPGGASTQSNVQQTLRVPSKSETAAAPVPATASAARAPNPKPPQAVGASTIATSIPDDIRRLSSDPAGPMILGQIAQSPHAEALWRTVPSGSRIAGHGFEAIVLDNPSTPNEITRIGRSVSGINERPKIDGVLQPISTQRHGNWTVERLPKVKMGASPEAVQELRTRLAAQGYDLYDAVDAKAIEANVGTLNGRAVVVDGGAVIKAAKPSASTAVRPPPPPVAANPLADRPARSTPIPRKMTAAELAERHSGVSTYVGRPTLASVAPKPPSAVGPKVGTSIPTPRGSGTITHSIAKTDGSTLHVVEGVKTDSGRTVVVEPATSAADAPSAFAAGDPVVGTDSVGTEYAGVVKSSGVSPKHGPYVEIETKMHGTRIVKAGNVRKTVK